MVSARGEAVACGVGGRCREALARRAARVLPATFINNLVRFKPRNTSLRRLVDYSLPILNRVPIIK